MKSDESYRFSLGWRVRCEDDILAGEFLRKLGKKKSRFIIELVANYVRAHPEALDANSSVKVVLESANAGRQLIENIKTLVLAELRQEWPQAQQAEVIATLIGDNKTDTAINAMLDDLDKWELR